jgi:hypothetical protein
LPDTIAIPANLGKCVEKLEDFKAAIFPDVQVNSRSPDWLSECAFLSPLNVNVNRLNNDLLKEFPGELQQFKSVDTAVSEEEAVHFPVEFLNSLDLPGLPPHILNLKVGSPIIILRSFLPPKVTNGTWCVIRQLHKNVIELEISCGPYKGEIVLLP